MKELMNAIRFLTIIPVKGPAVSAGDMAASIAAFPLAGLIQGALAAGAAYAASGLLPAQMAPAIALLVLAVSNGGFHLDGLSDTFDAFAKRGSAEEKLAAMKDGRAGAIGAAAIVFSLMLKYLALSGLPEALFYQSLCLMPVASKWAMAVSMLRGKAARAEGLGRAFIEGASGERIVRATFCFLAIAAIALLPFNIENAFLIVLSAASLYAASALLSRLFRAQFGGHTGDTLGATGEIAEIIFLLGVLIWSRLYI